MLWLALALTSAAVHGPSHARTTAPSALERIVLRQGGTRVPAQGAVSQTFASASVAGSRRASAATFVRTAYVRPRSFHAGGDGPDVFGSIAMPISRTPLDTRWRHVASGTLQPGQSGWTRLLDRQRSAPVATQLAVVNAWVNAHVRFASDQATSGRGDRWATAAETLASRRGDCEDYAIVKLQLLRLLGVPTSDLFLVIAHDLVRRQDHAVLVVRSGGELVMLDSGTDRLIDARQTSDYRPIMTFSGSRSWTHGYAVAPKDQFAAGRAPASVDPS